MYAEKCPQQLELVDRHFLPGTGGLRENSSIPGFFHGSHEIKEWLLVDRKCDDA